jgi:putative peptidoglycan binding protein
MTGALTPLKRGDRGDPVVELQMRLAGFRGTVPDGVYGPGTELQVSTFQRAYMQMADPDGAASQATIDAIAEFAAAHPVDFATLKCPCGLCGGFGQGRFRDVYRKPGHLEVFHRYEYPGMHRMLLWTCRAARFYVAARGWKLVINSAYRCEIDNAKHQRSSSNHHGKAIDIDIVPGAGAAGTDRQRCNTLRGLLVEKSNAQIGWDARNRKSLEPANIAPTWVHLDVRSYDRKYLDDKYFVKDAAALDAVPS